MDYEFHRRKAFWSSKKIGYKKVTELEGKRVYQEDLFMIAVELALKWQRREKIITKDFPSPCNLNQRVIVPAFRTQPIY